MTEGNLTISVDRDLVVIGLPGRTNIITMSPDTAELVANHGLIACEDAETWLKSGGVGALDLGRPLGAKVQSHEGRVIVRLSEHTDRVPIPVKRFAGDKEVNPARALFEDIRAKVVEARYNLTVDNRMTFRNLNRGG